MPAPHAKVRLVTPAITPNKRFEAVRFAYSGRTKVRPLA